MKFEGIHRDIVYEKGGFRNLKSYAILADEFFKKTETSAFWGRHNLPQISALTKLHLAGENATLGIMATALVWTGIAVYVLSLPLQHPLLLIGGMVLSIAGLVWFHRQHKHPAKYAVLAALVTVLLPVLGAMVGLAIRPKNELSVGDRSSYQSMRSLGIFFILISLLILMSPTLGKLGVNVMISPGLFCSGVFLWLAGFGGSKGWKYCPLVPLITAIGTFLIMLGGCFLSAPAH